MAECVLDASAVLALLLEAPGFAEVEARLPGAAISSVALAEVVAWLVGAGMGDTEVEAVLASLALQVEPFDEGRARWAGALRGRIDDPAATAGDLASLALAGELGVPLLTARPGLAPADLGLQVETLPQEAAAGTPAG